MRIGQVVGKVVLSRVHPSLRGAQFKVVLPLTFSDLAEPEPIEEANRIADEEAKLGLASEEQIRNAVDRVINRSTSPKWGNEVVVFDDCSAAIDEWLAFSEGAEAAASFGVEHPHPIDAFGAAIIDNIEVDSQLVAKMATAGKNK